MNELKPKWALISRGMDWVDAHLSWFFTNGNKVRVDEELAAHEDHLI